MNLMKTRKENESARSKALIERERAYRDRAVTLTLPPTFIFKDHDLIDFSKSLSFFDWTLENRPVRIDFTQCESANYQTLSLLVPYVWRLRTQGCRISFGLADPISGASQMWRRMGGQGAFNVSTNPNDNFKGDRYKPLVAIRNAQDFKNALNRIENYTTEFDVEYLRTLRYVISELLYNTLEHGISTFWYKGRQLRTPSIVQFTWYDTRKELHFIVADTGVGIKRHLEQAYPPFESHADAIRYAIRPQVSGTFFGSDPYQAKNNAGVGLFISSNIVRRLNADMHIVSGDGVLHVSPRDISAKIISQSWPGTFVLVSVRLEAVVTFGLHAMMQEFRQAAEREIHKAAEMDADQQFYLHISNYFGPNAEDKEMAIRVRDTRLLPAVTDGKRILVDFEGVRSAPHSFLSALLATPIRVMGLRAYKNIKVVNASPEIRETIDFILDENTNQ
jgi:hypothetical protein